MALPSLFDGLYERAKVATPASSKWKQTDNRSLSQHQKDSRSARAATRLSGYINRRLLVQGTKEMYPKEHNLLKAKASMLRNYAKARQSGNLNQASRLRNAMAFEKMQVNVKWAGDIGIKGRQPKVSKSTHTRPSTSAVPSKPADGTVNARGSVHATPFRTGAGVTANHRSAPHQGVMKAPTKPIGVVQKGARGGEYYQVDGKKKYLSSGYGGKKAGATKATPLKRGGR